MDTLIAPDRMNITRKPGQRVDAPDFFVRDVPHGEIALVSRAPVARAQELREANTPKIGEWSAEWPHRADLVPILRARGHEIAEASTYTPGGDDDVVTPGTLEARRKVAA